jgi:hypothetical protein
MINAKCLVFVSHFLSTPFGRLMKRKLNLLSQETIPIDEPRETRILVHEHGKERQTSSVQHLEDLWTKLPLYDPMEIPPSHGVCWVCNELGSLHIEKSPYQYPARSQWRGYYTYICDSKMCRSKSQVWIKYYRATRFLYVTIPTDWKNAKQLVIPRTNGTFSSVVLVDGGLFLDSQYVPHLECVFRLRVGGLVCKTISWTRLKRLNPSLEWLCPLSPQLQDRIFQCDDRLVSLL